PDRGGDPAHLPLHLAGRLDVGADVFRQVLGGGAIEVLRCRRVELEAVELDGEGHALVPAGEVTDAGLQVALADVAPRADDIVPHVDPEGLAHAPSLVESGRNAT